MLRFVYWKLLTLLLLLITGLYWAYSVPQLRREVYEVHYIIDQKANQGFAAELPDILGIPPAKNGLLQETFAQLEILVWVHLRELGYELPKKGMVIVNPPEEKGAAIKVHLSTSAADHLRLQDALSQALGPPASDGPWHGYTQETRLDFGFDALGRRFGIREAFEWQLAPDSRPQAQHRTFLIFGAKPDNIAEFVDYPTRVAAPEEATRGQTAPEWELNPTVSWYVGRAWYLLLGLTVVLFTLVYFLCRPLGRAVFGHRESREKTK